MGSIFELLARQLKDTLGADADPPPPISIQSLSNELAELASIQVSSWDDIQRWINRWRALFSDRHRDTLLVRALQMKLPRVSEVATCLGLITFEDFADVHPPQGGYTRLPGSFRIDFDRLSKLIKPDNARSPEFWLGLLLSKAASKDDLKALKALFGLLIAFPDELIKLEYRRLGFTGLPGPGGPILELSDLTDLINSPFPIPLPVDLSEPIAGLGDLRNRLSAPSVNQLLVDGPDAINGAGISKLQGLGVGIKSPLIESLLRNRTVNLGDGWTLSANTPASGPAAWTLSLGSDGKLQIGGVSNKLTIDVGKGQGLNAPAFSFGDEKKTQLKIGRSSFSLTVSASDPWFEVGLNLDPVEVAIDGADLARGLIGAGIVPPIHFGGAFSLVIDRDRGWHLEQGGIRFERVVPVGIDLGALKIPSIRLVTTVGVSSAGVTGKLEALASASITLGPIEGSMEGAGVAVLWNSSGNPETWAIKPVPPSGVGLSITASVITGGGFVSKLGSPESTEFGGALSLKLLAIGVSAFGIYKKLPSGDASIIAMLGIRFPGVGIQLSWGFALAGVGGLVGINRRANTDLLRDRLSSGAAGNVLFNDNPAQNAPALINDLRQFFPDELGTFIVGPTLQITWGVTLISVDLGVFIELPGPRKIFIAGSLRVLVGATPDVALVYLRLDFIGGVDFTRELIFFDAALINSHVMQIFRITGGCAVRICYGESSYFLFSVGGFHPSFNPSPLDVPRLARAGATMTVGAGVRVWLKLEMYYAVTPNTVQAGAAVEAGLEIGPLSAHGWLRFDALIQFKPFYFEAAIDAGFDVSVEGVSLCGVRVQGMLSGPGPIVIAARASVKILFVRISGNVTIRLGSSGEQPETITDLLDRVARRLGENANQVVRCEGADPWVSLKPQSSAASRPLISPVGRLIWEQRAVPLSLTLARFDGVKLANPARIRVDAPPGRATTPVTEAFTVGLYVELSSSEALNNSRFSNEQSGLRFGDGAPVLASPAVYVPKSDLKKIPRLIRLSSLIADSVGNSWSGGLSAFHHERLGSVPGRGAVAASPVDGASYVRPTTRPDRWQAQSATEGRSSVVSSVQAWSMSKMQGGFSSHATDGVFDMSGVFVS